MNLEKKRIDLLMLIVRLEHLISMEQEYSEKKLEVIEEIKKLFEIKNDTENN